MHPHFKWYDVRESTPPLASLDDWLPQQSEDVLVVTRCGTKFTAYLREGFDVDEALEWIQRGRDAYVMKDVVAWMPLPDYP